MAIDKNSPEFMFGQILQRLDEGDTSRQEVKTEITKLTNAINKLPCQEREGRIAILEQWKKKIGNGTTFKAETLTKFKYTLLVSIITAVVTSGLTYLAVLVSH